VTDRHRKVAFASAAVVLLGITIFLALRDPGLGPRHDTPPLRPAGTTTIRTGPPPASESGEADGSGNASPRSSPTASTSSAPAFATQGEREAKSPPAVAPREARAATAAARAFLDGYLPYSYGQSDAGRSERRLGGCCGSSRRHRRECRRPSPGPSPADLRARAGGDQRSGRRGAGGGRGRPTAVPHPARRAPRRPPLDRDSGPRLTRVSVVVQPRVARRLIAAGAAAIALLGLLLVLLVATLMGGWRHRTRAGREQDRGTRHLLSRWQTSRATTCSGSAKRGTGMGWTGA
jgi:hypothetical protein